MALFSASATLSKRIGYITSQLSHDIFPRVRRDIFKKTTYVLLRDKIKLALWTGVGG